MNDDRRPRIQLTRTITLPDELRVARCRRAPDLGPRILFFSGGTALRPLCRHLKRFTHNSIHLVTPFDSGGSSAKLREAFGMFSVGDLRNRLIALADETLQGNPEIYRLFSYRFEQEADPERLARRLERMVDGTHELVAKIPDPLRRLVRSCLQTFVDRAPPDFDLRAASIGNLVLVGGWLEHDLDVDSIVFLFSKLVSVLGSVRPITDVAAHLAFELANGETVVGQHLVTGKGGGTVDSKIESMRLVKSFEDPSPVEIDLDPRIAQQVQDAGLVVYPMGSFFTSVLANLLVRGVTSAIRMARCPKIHVPSLGRDPEAVGYDLPARIQKLHETLQRNDEHPPLSLRDVLDYVVLDPRTMHAQEIAKTRELGVEVIELELVTSASRPYYDPDLLSEVLLSLA
ncbi:MAG: GAK system CofD-like protein [Planctomycetes bacterium]|nr:GAK system CofD-like protein [Planctomycetota bacterium]